MTKKRLSSLITLLFLAAFAFYFFKHKSDFRPLLDVPLWALLVVGITKMAVHMLGGLFMKLTVEVFTQRMKFLEGFYVAVLSAIGNFFGPLLGGATVRAVYLKKVHKLSYSKFTSTLFGYYVILFSINSLLAIIALLLLRDNGHNRGLLTFFIAWLIGLILVMLIRLPARRRLRSLDKGKVGKFFFTVVYDIEHGWDTLLKAPRLIPKLCLLAVGLFVITMLTVAAEFKAIGTPLPLAAIMLYTAISTSALLISLTPGAIGIRESLLLLTAPAMGVTNQQILQVAVIDRGVNFITLFILYLMTKSLKRRLDQAGDKT